MPGCKMSGYNIPLKTHHSLDVLYNKVNPVNHQQLHI